MAMDYQSFSHLMSLSQSSCCSNDSINMIDIQVDLTVYQHHNPVSPETPPVQVTESDTNRVYTYTSPGLAQPEQSSSASCLDSNTESEVKKELKSLLKNPQYFDQFLELTASLAHTSKEGLQVMETDGLVKLLYEGIQDDCLTSYGAQISIKNLYIYFDKKGFHRIAEDSLRCEENVIP